MKTKLLLSTALLGLSAAAYAQDNPMTHYPDNYGENYKSIAFDGTRDCSFSTPALYFKGKESNTYAIWGDTWGDVVAGKINNQTKAVKTSVLLNDKMLGLGSYAAALSISKSGVVTAFVAQSARNGVIDIFTAPSAESVGEWIESELATNLAIKQLCAVSNTQLLALTQSGEIYKITKNGSAWSAAQKLSAPKAQKIKLIQGGDSVAFLIDDQIYNYANGALSSGVTVEGAICDISLGDQGAIDILYSNQGAYYLQSSDSKKPAKLPLSGEIVEVILDRETPNTIYYTSIQDSISEIAKLSKDGRRWVSNSITVDSPYNNRNLVSIVGAPQDAATQITWLQEAREDVKVNQLAALKIDMIQPQVTDAWDKEQIKTLMAKVADWQLTYSFTDKTKRDWHWGAFYLGLIDAYEVTGDSRYLEELMNVGEYFNWELEPDVMHADRLIVCDIYAYLYEKTGRQYPEMINPTRWAMDLHTTRKATIEPGYKGANNKYEWWTWCDALYMAPPSFYTFSKMMGDSAAMDFAYQQWQDVADYLYSKEHSLFFRDDRFFNEVSSNGGKVFWARGNGWVFGAMPRILETLPADHPHRPYYEQMFREMAAKFLELQRPEGLWTVSLLDPEELLRGESSGSGFYGYGFAWGVNNGILDAEVYGEAAKRAWSALSANVSQFGRLGYVQQVAGSPFPFYEYQAHTYASGTFIMFANEMLQLLD